MQVVDLADAAVEWLSNPTPASGFQSWFDKAPEWVALGFSGLGTLPGSDKWKRLVQHAASSPDARLLKFVEEGDWRPAVLATIEQVVRILGDVTKNVSVVVLVGLGIRNAGPGYCQKHGFAFLFLEHFLPPGSGSGWFDLGASTIPTYRFGWPTR